MTSKDEQSDCEITRQFFIICHVFEPTILRQKLGPKKCISENRKGKNGTISAEGTEIRLQLPRTLQKLGDNYICIPPLHKVGEYVPPSPRIYVLVAVAGINILRS